MKTSKNKGFTLLEILLVIAAIGILASIVIVAINPLRQLSKAENASRWSNINTLQKALDQYYIANGKYPDEVVTNATGEYKEICIVGQPVGCIDLEAELVPQYIAEIPRDPNGGGYKVGINQLNNQISVWADRAKLEESVSINLFTPVVGGSSTFAFQEEGYFSNLGVTTYSNGSSFISGTFVGAATFGEGVSQVVLNSEDGTADIFIAKYNSSGTLEWVKRAGGSGWDFPHGITSYNDANIFVVGDFQDIATFGEGGNQVSLDSSSNGNVFVAKYNSAGDLVWVRQLNGVHNYYGGWNSIVSHSDGSIVVTGLGPFIAKYDLAGNLIWNKAITVGSWARIKKTISYSDGSSVIVGNSTGAITFGEGIGQVTINTSGDTPMFLAKYNSNGDLVWAKAAGGIESSAESMVSYNDGSSVVTGTFAGTTIFGEGANQISLVGNGPSNGPRDIFVAKYDMDGDLVWVKKAGSASAAGIIGDNTDGSSIVTGSFGGPSTFGELGNQVNLLGGGGDYSFIAKYSNTGELLWAKEAGGGAYTVGTSISNYSNGIAVVGFFDGISLFGELGNQISLESIGSNNLFMVKYNADGTLD